MSVLDRLYRPEPRGFAAWTVLAVIGWFLDGPIGLVPALVVAVVAAARLDRGVLGRIGVVLVATAGAVVLLDSSGGADDVHLHFVVRTMAPHHLTFVGLSLVIVRMLLEGRPGPVPGGGTADPDLEPRDADLVPEPLAGRSDRFRVLLTLVVVAVAALTVLGISLT